MAVAATATVTVSAKWSLVERRRLTLTKDFGGMVGCGVSVATRGRRPSWSMHSLCHAGLGTVCACSLVQTRRDVTHPCSFDAGMRECAVCACARELGGETCMHRYTVNEQANAATTLTQDRAHTRTCAECGSTHAYDEGSGTGHWTSRAWSTGPQTDERSPRVQREVATRGVACSGGVNGGGFSNGSLSRCSWVQHTAHLPAHLGADGTSHADHACTARARAAIGVCTRRFTR